MIQDLKLEMPKNAKVFKDTKNGNVYAVHYNHVVLVVIGNEIKDLYPAGQTSCDVIRRTIYHLGLSNGFFDILPIYNKIHNTDFKKISEIYDYGYKLTGYYYPERLKKADWEKRAIALETFNYNEGLRLI